MISFPNFIFLFSKLPNTNMDVVRGGGGGEGGAFYEIMCLAENSM